MSTAPTSSTTQAPALPSPGKKAVPFARVSTYDETVDYALAGHHASLQKADKSEGARGRLWRDAAEAYRSAYLALLTLKTLPEATSVQQGKELLARANHLADEAAAHESS
jgi:hypothetical protein